MRTTQSRAVITRTSILDAACRQFAQNGYAGTSLADITHAGASKGAVYFHFTSKAEIAENVLSVWAAANRERLATAAASKMSPLHQLVMVCYDTIGTGPQQVAMRAALRLMLDLRDTAATEDPAHTTYAEWVTGFTTLVDRAVAAGQLGRQTDTCALADFICSTLMGSVLASTITGHSDQNDRNLSRLMASVLAVGVVASSVDTRDVLAARLPAHRGTSHPA
ncbi:TetR family transcriptional regulator [Rhodococcus hoagii]|nr:TetR family transcriptional regulator [Prescottella equi]NKS72204.1 TetR family transcriptional regulator [Prescottella equi]